MKTLRSPLTLCAALACLIQAPALAATPSYTITGIGLGGNYSVAYDINNNGLVVGGSSFHAFQYGGGMATDIGAVVGGSNTAIKVNDGGQVLISQGGGAYSIYSGGVVTSVGAVAGSNPYTLNGMNNGGQLAGSVNLLPESCNMDYCDDAIDHAFTYSNGVMTDLGTLSGGSGSSFANSINNLGQVAGASRIYGIQHAFLYSDGVMSDLGTLGGSYSTAYGINDFGKVVGVSDGPMGYGVTQAFLYSDGIMTGLGTLGGSYSAAMDINNGGLVVGYSYTASTEHAFLYGNGVMVDLNSLLSPSSGWTLNRAYAINDLGQIVGYGSIGGKTQAFLMTPTAVPAPAAAWLFGSGLIGLAGFARRRVR